MFEWVLVILSITCTFVVAKYKDKNWGFWGYLVIDILWIIADYKSLLWARLFKRFVYIILAIYGIKIRRNKKEEKREKERC